MKSSAFRKQRRSTKSKLPIEPQCSNTTLTLTRHPTRSVSLKLLTRPTASFQIQRPDDLMIRRPLPARRGQSPLEKLRASGIFLPATDAARLTFTQDARPSLKYSP